MKVVVVARIAIPNLEVKALLVQIADPKQAHLAVVTVGRRLALLANRLANRMVCNKKNSYHSLVQIT